MHILNPCHINSSCSLTILIFYICGRKPYHLEETHAEELNFSSLSEVFAKAHYAHITMHKYISIWNCHNLSNFHLCQTFSEENFILLVTDPTHFTFLSTLSLNCQILCILCSKPMYTKISYKLINWEPNYLTL